MDPAQALDKTVYCQIRLASLPKDVSVDQFMVESKRFATCLRELADVFDRLGLPVTMQTERMVAGGLTLASAQERLADGTTVSRVFNTPSDWRCWAAEYERPPVATGMGFLPLALPALAPLAVPALAALFAGVAAYFARGKLFVGPPEYVRRNKLLIIGTSAALWFGIRFVNKLFDSPDSESQTT
jgi:hypothetical protein